MTLRPELGADMGDGGGPGRPGRPGFEHDAVIYRSTSELAAAVAPFISEAVQAEEPVSVITSEVNLGAIADAVGEEADRVSFIDNGRFYDTPARTIANAHELREELLASGASRARLLGEVPFGSTDEERLDWLRYEAILNGVFASVPQWCVCFYDRRELPGWLVEGAYRTHPHVLARGGSRAVSSRFEDPVALTRELGPPPPHADGEPAVDMRITVEGLAAAREAVAEVARSASASERRATELAVGLNEIVTNAVEHGSEHASVRCWQNTDEVVCEVVDDGEGFDDPFAGFRPPAPRQEGGRGLWLARQIFERVELEGGEGTGLRARLAAQL